MGRATRARQAAARRRRNLIAVACGAIVVALLGVMVVVVAVNGSSTSDQTSATDGTIESTQAAVGKAFPDFTLTGVDGKKITKASLAGKKTLIWFTDSSCPDADGVQQTAQLDDKLGGQAFHVMAVLVNLRESSPELGEWRDAFGRPDWLVAPDSRGDLTTKVHLQALETKFLLDEHGTVVDVRADLVTPDYLNLLRQQAAKP